MPSADDSGVHVGSVLDGRYRIDSILGTGGMGKVFRGEHTGIGKQVAIKVLHADLGKNREAAQRFQREALASGRLDHANIVGVSDFGVIDDGPCYLVMEALEGESLGDRLEREKRIAWPEAIAILRGILYGLRHAHDRGVVHRDIKPDNVFLAQKDGELVIKILDFGIAKLAAGTTDDPAATRAGLTVGTPAYLSPEQAVGGEITPACDLYSATIVLYEMLSGRAPFEDKDPLAMLGAHVGRPPPPLGEIAPDVELPPGLEELIQRGLAKLVVDRIATAADYLILLDQVSPEPARVRMSTSQPVMMTPAAGMPIVLGSAPTASLEVIPGGPATPLPMPSLQLPVVMTPVPGTMTNVPVAQPMTAAPTPFEIPNKWILIGAFVVVGLLIVAFVLATTRTPATVTVPVPVPVAPPPVASPPAKPTKAAAPVAKPPPDPDPAPEVTTPPPDAAPPTKKPNRPRPGRWP